MDPTFSMGMPPPSSSTPPNRPPLPLSTPPSRPPLPTTTPPCGPPLPPSTPPCLPPPLPMTSPILQPPPPVSTPPLTSPQFKQRNTAKVGCGPPISSTKDSIELSYCPSNQPPSQSWDRGFNRRSQVNFSYPPPYPPPQLTLSRTVCPPPPPSIDLSQPPPLLSQDHRYYEHGHKSISNHEMALMPSYGMMSATPSVFNINVPPPSAMFGQPPSAYSAPTPTIGIGIPFPPPGYAPLKIKETSDSFKERETSPYRRNRRSRSRNRSRSPLTDRRQRSPTRDRGDRNRDRNQGRDYDRRRERERERERDRNRERDRDRNRERDRERERDRDRGRERERNRGRERDHGRSHEKSRTKSPEKNKESRPIDVHLIKTERESSVGSNPSSDQKNDSRSKENTHAEGSEINKKVRVKPEGEGEDDVDSIHSGKSGANQQDGRPLSERETLVERWRLNNCSSLQEMTEKLEVLSKMDAEEIIELEKQTWTRSAPATLYYQRQASNPNVMEATPRLMDVCERFEAELIKRAEHFREKLPPYDPPPRKTKYRVCKHKLEVHSSSSSCDDSSSDEEDKAMEELERKRQHPQRLHSELWHNEQGEMNDGPLCRCSHRARRSGIRHNVYVGEQQLEKCDINTNNSGKLFHYRITMSPPVNFLTKTPTIIEHDSHEYIFEGFSMFSHFPLGKLPTCKVIRFNIEYTILYIDETTPENFTICELDLFYKYLFYEILELFDLDLRAFGDPTGCNQFHFMPRFVRDLPENGKEILSMNEVLKYLLRSNKPLIEEDFLKNIQNMSLYEWQTFADEVKCMVVTYPGMKPCSLRVDQLDRDMLDEGQHPEIVHFGIRPPQLSYAGNPEYQKAWREYVKSRHLLANMPKPSAEDKRRLTAKENRLQEMRTLSKMKRDVTIALSSKGFYRTGIMCDIVQHAMLLPVLVCHLRFHRSLDQLEKDMDYKFNNRYLLQLALTHPSYRENFGTNPDHARNSLTNCGIRQPEYGDRRIHYLNTRKRGINTLIQIMSRFGKKEATESNIGHNERLEFLGDAVVEFITSIHLFHLFPDLEEGGLATYRAAIVQNQHLAVLAQRLNLDAYMLYAHGSDLCHDLELRHAMANCFEALMGALFLDGGIEVADKVFGTTLWKDTGSLVDTWMNYPLHPLQEQEPETDRQWIDHFPALQKLTEFEQRTGIEFRHIRLLARAFTDRSVGYTNLTMGSNQRLEFLGDTVLQIIASEYLYKFFPEHHEGHLSLLRSSLVNNRTQAVVCDDLAMTQYAIYANPKHDIKTKDRADLLEAFLGALYIDKGLKHCHVFCEVCFFPRLQDFIMNQDWNDPKSKLQQCCLTLRTMEGGEPDIPVYKVIECMGPTNTRVYTVAVYFRGQRLAQASGHSIQMAEMNAAKQALSMSTELFPQLDHQKRVIAKSMKKHKKRAKREAQLRATHKDKWLNWDKRRDQERQQENSVSKLRDQDKRSENSSGACNKFREQDRRFDNRSRDRSGERNRSRERGRDRSRERDRVRNRSRDRDRDRNRDREKDKDWSRDRERNRDREHNKERSRDRERDRSKERERFRDREKTGDRDQDDDLLRKDRDVNRRSREHEKSQDEYSDKGSVRGRYQCSKYQDQYKNSKRNGPRDEDGLWEGSGGKNRDFDKSSENLRSNDRGASHLPKKGTGSRSRSGSLSSCSSKRGSDSCNEQEEQNSVQKDQLSRTGGSEREYKVECVTAPLENNVQQAHCSKSRIPQGDGFRNKILDRVLGLSNKLNRPGGRCSQRRRESEHESGEYSSTDEEHEESKMKTEICSDSELQDAFTLNRKIHLSHYSSGSSSPGTSGSDSDSEDSDDENCDMEVASAGNGSNCS